MIKKAILYSLCCLTLLTTAMVSCGNKDASSSNTNSPEQSEFASIAGSWRTDTENGAAVLRVREDRSYLLLYALGGTESGTVKPEKEDGGKQSRFLFYDDASDLWAESDFISASSAKPREITLTSKGKKMIFTAIDENQKTPAEDYLGSWQCGRCSITISQKGDSYPVNIIWGSSASESAEWSYLCRYDEETATLICDSGAKMANVVYDDNGKEKETVLYSDGSGSFKVRGDILTWTDNKEDRGKDMIFERLPVER